MTQQNAARQWRSLFVTVAAVSSLTFSLSLPQDPLIKLKKLSFYLQHKMSFRATNTGLISVSEGILQNAVAGLTIPSETLPTKSLSPVYFQGKTIRSVNLKGKEKAIALTFDDGPSVESTNQILYILKSYDIKATFFVTGHNVQKYPSRALQIVQHGHAIGNHTWSHRYSYHTQQQAAKEIENTAAVIGKYTGVKTSLFRPPGGFLKNGLVAYASQENYANIMWSADGLDYRYSAPRIVKSILQQAKPGGIILLHDGGGDRFNTVVALPTIITTLKKRGYSFVTIPELLEMGQTEISFSHTKK